MGQSVQVSMSVAPALVEYVPAPQAVHTSPEIAPGEPEYLPAAQSVLHTHTQPLIVSATTQGVTGLDTHSRHLQCALRLRAGGAKREFEDRTPVTTARE
jgi:hypothetical protein